MQKTIYSVIIDSEINIDIWLNDILKLSNIIYEKDKMLSKKLEQIYKILKSIKEFLDYEGESESINIVDLINHKITKNKMNIQEINKIFTECDKLIGRKVLLSIFQKNLPNKSMHRSRPL